MRRVGDEGCAADRLVLSRRAALGGAVALTGLPTRLSVGTADASDSKRASVETAWVRFARTGDPNGAGLPTWPAFTAERVPTMVFDNHCQALDGPDAPEQTIIAQST